MKTTILLSVAVVLCAFYIHGTSALPIDDVVEFDTDANAGVVYDVAESTVDAPSRQKRATCDLLSGLGWSHAPCAAHCILKGFKGGYCSGKAVCHCRR